MREKIDVLKEVQEKKAKATEVKEFMESLDQQHLPFRTYIYAVMGRFQCDSTEAGKIIGRHIKGEYHG